MPLSCSCDYDWEPEPGAWEFDREQDVDFEPLQTSKRKRCVSCRELIGIGDLCLRFPRYRHPYTEIEARIYGVDFEYFEEPVIKKAPIFQCEKCGEIYLNLQSVGFKCVSPCEDQRDLLIQYQHDYAPPKLINKTFSSSQ